MPCGDNKPVPWNKDTCGGHPRTDGARHEDCRSVSGRHRRFRARLTKRRLATAGPIVVPSQRVCSASRPYRYATQTNVTAYFANTNGLYVGDNVKIMGVDVGKIDQIKPDGDKMKVKFHVRGKHRRRPTSRPLSSRRRWSAHASSSSPRERRRPAVGVGCGHPDRPDRGAGRMGRLPQAARTAVHDAGGAGDDSRSGKRDRWRGW